MITFAAALDEAQTWLAAAQPDWIYLQHLLATAQGARGFFVVLLTSDHDLSAAPELITILNQAPDPVPELLVKNLVMAQAMIVWHTRHADHQQAAESARVVYYCQQLLPQVRSCQLPLREMWLTLTTGSGIYNNFLQKWGYDETQKLAMQEVLQPLVIY